MSLRFALFPGQPDHTIFDLLLKDYQEGLGKRYEGAKREVPDRHEPLAKLAIAAMPTDVPVELRDQIQTTVADFERQLVENDRAAAQGGDGTERLEALSRAGEAAIEAILAHVKKVATAASGDAPEYLMRLLGIAECIGRTVMKA